MDRTKPIRERSDEVLTGPPRKPFPETNRKERRQRARERLPRIPTGGAFGKQPREDEAR